MEKIKILMVIDNLNKCDGIASYVMNYYKKMNLKDFCIDFVISKTENGVDEDYVKIIEENGGKIFYHNNITFKDMLQGRKEIKKFFENNRYDIVHCHILNMGYFYLKYAKKNGVKVRILHSHTTYLWAENYLKRIRNSLFKELTISQANVYYACSNLAGKFLFKNKKFKLIHNAIEAEKFSYNLDIRMKMRATLKIKDDCIVYGHVGRLNVQKNHKFLIDVFEGIHNKNDNSILLLIGKGELHDEILEYIKSKDLEKSVWLLGERDDISNLLQAMDVFLLPSLFEGLPISGIEAQATGIKSFFSNTITDEIQVINTTERLPISDTKIWIDRINECNYSRLSEDIVIAEIIEKHYDLKSEAINLENEYRSLVNREGTNEKNI